MVKNKKQQEQEQEATAPLLLGVEAHEEALAAAPATQPLAAGVVSSSRFYNDAPRQRRDVGWAIAYAVFSALVVAGGVALFATGARDFWQLASPEHLADPASCPVDRVPHARRGLLGLLVGDDEHDDESDFSNVTFTQLGNHAISAVLCTLLGSLSVGLLFILGIRYQPRAMILAAMGLQVGVVLAFGAWMAASAQLIASGFLFAYAALLVGLFWLWRDQIKLVGRLLGMTGNALADNPSLVLLGLTTPLVWAAIFVSALFLSVGAFSNGHVAPNPARGGRPATKGPDGHLQCLGGEDGTDVVPCCAWELEPQAWAYFTLLGVALTWTSMLLGQIKLFATAGAVAQWYFIPAEPSLQSKAAGPSKDIHRGGRPVRRRRVLRALRHALGPQFGSLCAGAALLTLVSYLRQALDAAERQARNDNKVVAIICVILVAILRILLSLVEFLTRFTTVRMAVTGEGFMDAARGAVDLFKRNALDAFGVWWLPPFILGQCTLLLSVLLGTATWATASGLVYRTDDKHDFSAVAVGLVAFVTAWAVLAFLSGLLQNVIESVFLCFAMDRDAARVTRQDIYVLYEELPPVKKAGAVVQQPDGGVAYGQA